MLPESVQHDLRSAGWEPGRRVDIDEWVDVLHRDGFPAVHRAAESFYREYGGLFLPERGPGITRMKSSVDLDPALAVGERDRFEHWSRLTDRVLLPVGEIEDGRYFLAIDENAEMYLLAGWLATFGVGDDGLSALVQGDMLF